MDRFGIIIERQEQLEALRGRIIDHLQALFPDVERKKIEKLI